LAQKRHQSFFVIDVNDKRPESWDIDSKRHAFALTMRQRMLNRVVSAACRGRLLWFTSPSGMGRSRQCQVANSLRSSHNSTGF
jgi:hypothetical protein